MRKASVTLWRCTGVVLVTLLCSTSGWGAPGLKVEDGQTVAFLGDSITAYGWEKSGGYVKLINAGLAAEGVHINVVAAGVGGNTSRDMVARLDRDVLSKKPQWMTLSCGVNDVWHGASGVSLDQYKKNIASIVEQAQTAGIKLLILTSTPIGEDQNHNNELLGAYNDYLRELVREKNVPLVDLSAAFQQALQAGIHTPACKLLTVDGVHMNPAGNLLMAREILKGFGATESDLAKIEAVWDAIPAAGTISNGWKGGSASITLGQYHALESAAAKQHLNVMGLANGVFLDALRDVATAHQDDVPPNLDQIEADIQKDFEQRIISLAQP